MQMSRKLLTSVYARPLRTCLVPCRHCSSTKPPDNPRIKGDHSKGLVEEVDLATRVTRTRSITKKDLQFRTPWHETEGQRYNFLRAMYSDESNTPWLKLMQTPIDLSPASIKRWWARKKEEHEVQMQQYIPERNQVLGNELAAAHFIVHRGGAVKFFDEDRWIKADQFNNYTLPKFYDPDKILQAIDCTGVNLYYEGLVNFGKLYKLEWLSLNGCQQIDDWCMDRISNIFSETLVYLDIRNCPNITDRGLGALYKMQALKILYVDDMFMSSQFEMTCLMLEDLNPDLDIRV